MRRAAGGAAACGAKRRRWLKVYSRRAFTDLRSQLLRDQERGSRMVEACRQGGAEQLLLPIVAS